ncbi:MAG: DUF262 domain-containing protein [Bacteroidales bacterium]
MKENDLNLQIDAVRKEIKTDNFSISIRELIQIYKDGDLELTPAYQRLFRWQDDQKSRFIESLLIGIPTPPLFIAQKKGAKWTIVDGLQRVSTLLQLMGLLPDSKNKEELLPEFTFTETEKLPALEGLTWSTLDEDAQRIIRMSKLDLKIILVEDNIEAQYELFKRLNTGGLELEPQEIRNCLIIMADEEFYKKIENIKSDPEFVSSISLSPNKHQIELPMELILRYFIMKNDKIDYTKYNMQTTLLSQFIDKETISIINDTEFNINNEISIFERVFKVLNTAIPGGVFRKYNTDKSDFEGPFLQNLFEAIVPGIANNIDYYEQANSEQVKDKIIQMQDKDQYLEGAKRGVKALTRIRSMIEFSNDYFGSHE